MNLRRVIGILAIIVGVALLIFALYGKRQLEEGRLEIASAKQKVNQSNQLFSLNPVSKQIGKGVTSGAEGKIAAGERTVEQYQRLFTWCEVGGIILIILGAGSLILGRNRRGRSQR